MCAASNDEQEPRTTVRSLWRKSRSMLWSAVLGLGAVSACSGWPFYSPPLILFEAFGWPLYISVEGGDETNRRFNEFLRGRFPCQPPFDQQSHYPEANVNSAALRRAACAGVDPAKSLSFGFRWGVLCRGSVDVQWSSTDGRIDSIRGTYANPSETRSESG